MTRNMPDEATIRDWSTRTGRRVKGLSPDAIQRAGIDRVAKEVAETRQARLIRQQTTDPRNQLEKAFEADWLYWRKLRGELVDYYEHQSQRLKLANGDHFSPDYPAIEINPAGGVRTVFFEVKGEQRKGKVKAREDAVTKLKCAATKYRHYRFVLVWRDKGEWMFQDVLA